MSVYKEVFCLRRCLRGLWETLKDSLLPTRGCQGQRSASEIDGSDPKMRGPGCTGVDKAAL